MHKSTGVCAPFSWKGEIGQEGIIKLNIQRSAIIISHEVTPAQRTLPCSKCSHSISVPSRFPSHLPLQLQATLTDEAYQKKLIGHRVRFKFGFPEDTFAKQSQSSPEWNLIPIPPMLKHAQACTHTRILLERAGEISQVNIYTVLQRTIKLYEL